LSPAADDKHLPFLRFSEKHRRILNAYLRRNPTLLESSLAPLIRVSRLVDFDNKRSWFRTRVRADERHYHGGLRISVRRDHVLTDSYHHLAKKSPDEMRAKLSVQFVGEEGIDAGGVSREWYQVMAREIFNPNLALFIPVPEGGVTFQPNPNSIIQNDRGIDHLDFFRFVGRLVGKALHDGQLMDAYFTRSFYKHMLGLAITYEDIEAVDPEYFKNLKWMLEHDITDVLDLSFTAETDFFGRKQVRGRRGSAAAPRWMAGLCWRPLSLHCLVCCVEARLAQCCGPNCCCCGIPASVTCAALEREHRVCAHIWVPLVGLQST
jgi:hypothetical protein